MTSDRPVKPTALSARITRLEQRLDPKPGIIIVYVEATKDETEKTARERVCRERGLDPRDRRIVFGNDTDMRL